LAAIIQLQLHTLLHKHDKKIKTAHNKYIRIFPLPLNQLPTP